MCDAWFQFLITHGMILFWLLWRFYCLRNFSFLNVYVTISDSISYLPHVFLSVYHVKRGDELPKAYFHGGHPWPVNSPMQSLISEGKFLRVNLSSWDCAANSTKSMHGLRRKEAKTVVCGAIDALLEKKSLKPKDVGFWLWMSRQGWLCTSLLTSLEVLCGKD